MTIDDAIGWAAAVTSAVWGLPQCVHILRAGSTDGVSAGAWQATFWSGTSWAGYGVLTDRPQVIWCNAVMTVATVSILLLAVRGSDRRAASLWLPSVIGSVLTIVAFSALGEGAFTVAMVLPMLGAQSLHLYGAVTSHETRGLSVAAFAVGSSSHALWALYGWFSGSLSIVLLNIIGTGLMTSTIVVTRKRRRSRGGRLQRRDGQRFDLDVV